MAVAFVQQAAGSSAAASTTLTATFGAAPTSGNLLVLAMAGDKNTGALTLSGWTSLFSLLSASVSLYVWWKTSAGSETSVSPSWATSSAAGNMAWVGEYTDSAVPSGTWTLLGSASNITDETTVLTKATGTTAAVSQAGMGIAAAAVDSSQSVTTVSAWGNSFVTRYSGTGGAGRGGVFVAEDAVAAAATGSSTFNFAGTADQVSAAIGVWAKVAAAGASPRPVVSDIRSAVAWQTARRRAM